MPEAELRQACLDCGKAEVKPAPEGEGRTTYGLCEECYQRWLKRDPELTRWAFKGGNDK